MKRLVACVAALLGLASLISAQGGNPRGSGPATSSASVAPPAPAERDLRLADAPKLFEKYCFECHGSYKPEAGLSLERLLTLGPLGQHSETWEKVVDMLETEQMPPVDASAFPTAAERSAASGWIRSSLKAYETAHAGEPGRVTVRRLTSAEYAYAVQDLTGVEISVGIDASSDSVGGEGFTNFGDVQFVQDASIERYLDAAKVVADHAVIGAGPLEFYSDPGKTGWELSALARINELYSSKGFRVVSGEGGRPFGLERYGKALFTAWFFKHRVALGEPRITLRELAAREGITGRFAEHIWSVVNKPVLGYPSRDMVERWKQMPAPTRDVVASIAAGRAASDDLYKYLTTWPSWFFARGDLAAGGAGDESPLSFDDAALKVETTRKYTYALGPRGGLRARGPATPVPAGPTKVFLTFTSLNPTPGVQPTILWRNARVVTRVAAAPGRGGAPAAGRGAAGPVLSTEPLRSVLDAGAAAALKFGTSSDGSALGPDDFATTGPVTFEIPAAPSGAVAELQVEAELGRDRNGVVRVTISDRAEGTSRDAPTRVVFGDVSSAGYRTYRAGMAEYAALLPPNSHGEANPADKDPVPAPFDNTYNSPEHDAFVLKVKYQRTDDFFTANMVDGADRARLDQAWSDLFASWPYHDAYLEMLASHYKVDLKGRRLQSMDAAALAALPADMRSYVLPLKKHAEDVRTAQALAQPGHVRDVLAFASRAWRRPLSADESRSLRAFYDRSRVANGLDHADALRAVIARILVSPAFLYRVETVAEAAEKPLTNWEMASRLSFFLWSSIPDDELRRAASAGELTNATMLERQVRRMTADPKARRLSAEFFGQWLGFYRFDEYRGVDTSRFPEFTEAVRKAMYDEAVSTFEYLVRQARPLNELFHADYTFLNEPLAKFYGVTGVAVSKDAVAKVDGANAFNRGGALRLGSVLTTTSAPLRTSPVKRGDWVLRRILGTPTPPPPADAGSLPSDPQAFGGQTLRERLTQHKRNATCANCHLRIDPLGFPLEGFDNIGRARTAYADGTAVDTTGEFADKSTIQGADGLLQYLRSKDGQVMKTFSRKMLGYALGRTVLASDNGLIAGMVAAGHDATFADLATRIVTSRQFRNRQGRDDLAAVSETPTAAGVSAANRPEPLRAGAR